MTVGDLKEALDHYDDEMRMVKNGYETGIDDVSKTEVISIHINVNEAYWCGVHEVAVDDEGDEKALWIH